MRTKELSDKIPSHGHGDGISSDFNGINDEQSFVGGGGSNIDSETKGF